MYTILGEGIADLVLVKSVCAQVLYNLRYYSICTYLVEGNIRLQDKLAISVPYSNCPRITGHLAYYSYDIQLVVLSNNGLILTIKILD